MKPNYNSWPQKYCQFFNREKKSAQTLIPRVKQEDKNNPRARSRNVNFAL